MNTRSGFRFFLFVILLLVDRTGAQDLPVQIEKDVSVKMRDEVSLVADIYRPEGDGVYPVLLERTPYNRDNSAALARELASHGYIVVEQDVRGRYDSEGEFYPFLHETADGYDTVEWAAGLPGSNGKVGMFGGSYVGATQMLAAIGKPPHLESLVPYVTASEYYDGWTYQSGAFMEWFASSWTTGLAQDTLRRKADQRSRPLDWVWSLPAAAYKILDLPTAEELAPYYQDWVRHETDDSYWRRWTISDHYPEMRVKALHSGGWHDIFLKGTLKNYEGMRTGGSPEIRDSQRLLVGPWAHAATSAEGRIGDVTFGKEAVLDYARMIWSFADWALKDVANDFASGDPVRIFVMGENHWRGEREFPLARQQPTRYYLQSDRGANGVQGDGRLTLEPPPRQSRADVFVYDPANPVRTIGGRLCCGNEALPPGPFDQSPNEAREDVLVFSTPPLTSDTEVTGWITVELYAATSAPDTDFTALLADVSPDGYARFLTDGIVRARFRNSLAKPDPIEPGKVYRYEIDLWATSNLFKAGHKIRLYLSSSNFPRFNRNLNTGQDLNFGTGMSKATQKIHHDAERPSALVLPIIPRR